MMLFQFHANAHTIVYHLLSNSLQDRNMETTIWNLYNPAACTSIITDHITSECFNSHCAGELLFQLLLLKWIRGRERDGAGWREGACVRASVVLLLLWKDWWHTYVLFRSHLLQNECLLALSGQTQSEQHLARNICCRIQQKNVF